MMQSTKFIYLVLLLAVIISGCRKDERMDGSSQEFPSNDPTVKVTGSVTGLITDENNTVLRDATVTVNGIETSTDENGIFVIGNIPLNSDLSRVQIKREGYFDGFKTFIPKLGAKSFLHVKMVELGSPAQFEANMGGTVDVNGGGRVVFSENSIVEEDGGSVYNGRVDVYTHWYDPTDLEMPATMPGNLLAIDENENEIQLGTYGMVAVELKSSDGKSLQLATGTKATIVLPVSAELDPPNTIPLWSFDEIDLYWKEEGTARLTDGFYEGEVSHFSFWNCDAPFPLVNIKGRIVYQGNPVNNRIITIITDNLIASSGFTDNQGYFEGKMPKDENLTLQITNCGRIILEEELGSFSNDADVGEIEVDLQNFEAVIKGRMLDCFDDPLQNAYGLVKSEEKVVHIITPVSNGNNDGVFNSILAGCDFAEYTVQFIDPESVKSSEVFELDNNLEEIDLGDVRICDDLDEFIQFSVDGESAPLIVEAEVFVSNGNKAIIRGGAEGELISFDLDIFATSPGDYNPSGAFIQGIESIGNVELQLVCGDHYMNEFTCDQFEVNITRFDDVISGTFTGVLVGGLDSLFTPNPNYEEYVIDGAFRVKVDEEVTTGEISGQFWIDDNGNNTRDIDEDRPVENQQIVLARVGGWPRRLFLTNINSYNNTYKFTNIEPGIYAVRVYDNRGYELVMKDVGDESTDSDFVDIGNFFESHTIEITSDEIIQNIDMGIQTPKSVDLGWISSDGCKPNITVYAYIYGGLPPYQVTLSDGQTMTTSQGYAFFNVSEGGQYTMSLVDDAGNTDDGEAEILDYKNTIRGTVWRDRFNGTPDVYDSEDDYLSDVLISLYSESGTLISETLSSFGKYILRNVPSGNHYIEVSTPTGLKILDQNTTLTNGNDIDPATGRSEVFFVDDCYAEITVDVGFGVQ